MAKKKAPRDLSKFKDLIEKEYPNFFEAVNGSTKDELEWMVVDFAKKSDYTTTSMDETEEIKEMRDKITALKKQLASDEAPFRDSINEFELKRLFALRFMKERFPDQEMRDNIEASVQFAKGD